LAMWQSIGRVRPPNNGRNARVSGLAGGRGCLVYRGQLGVDRRLLR